MSVSDKRIGYHQFGARVRRGSPDLAERPIEGLL